MSAKMKILVTGGCGYIGSHTLVDLIDNGYEVVSADNLSNGTEAALDGVETVTGVRVQNYQADLTNLTEAKKIFKDHPDIKGIIHFAAFKSVGDSVFNPIGYFDNNLNSLLNMLRCAEEFDVPYFIFSSSCSVYGNTKALPVVESTPFEEAESPYARTKQMGEQIIKDFSKKEGNVHSVLLRYFNPAGAHESAELGEAPGTLANNLVPVITETAIGKRESMTVFGDDYDTRDGSCVRDYIHVMDLANAHVKALEYLAEGRNETKADVFNLGIGEGVTVLEAINAFEKTTEKKLNYTVGARRGGDVVAIYADPNHSMNALQWKPTRNIDQIMLTAWNWEKARTKAAEMTT